MLWVTSPSVMFMISTPLPHLSSEHQLSLCSPQFTSPTQQYRLKAVCFHLSTVALPLAPPPLRSPPPPPSRCYDLVAGASPAGAFRVIMIPALCVPFVEKRKLLFFPSSRSGQVETLVSVCALVCQTSSGLSAWLKVAAATLFD